MAPPNVSPRKAALDKASRAPCSPTQAWLKKPRFYRSNEKDIAPTVRQAAG
jgi:hypothetical protein